MQADGTRRKPQPAAHHGRWTTRRRVIFAALIAVYVLAPFVTLNGHPAIHLDVQHRRFFLLGQTFNAQDLWLLLLLLLGFTFALLFVTASKGRVWCGFACPQTVFLEGVYRPIEHLIEGSREKRLKLDAAKWSSFDKLWRRGLKNTIFFIISVAIAHTAAAIFVSPAELWLMVREGPMGHLEAFGLTAGFTAILTFNFAWFREQFCVVMCPYGRMQSVLLDKDSVSVAYDERRGEPRGHVSTVSPKPLGDCIDCNRCVAVCPTGIDIRNGLQMECLACTQCIDACDEVMIKVSKPAGLIRYASSNELQDLPRPGFWGRPRLVVYGALAVLSLGVLGVSLAQRMPFESNIVRQAGATPWVIERTSGTVRNDFEVHLINKNPAPATFRLRILDVPGVDTTIATPHVTVASLADVRIAVTLRATQAALSKGPLELSLEIADELSLVTKTQPLRFLAPLPVAR